MPRDILESVSSAAEAETVRAIGLARLDFESQPIRVTSAPFDIDFNNETYSGIGDFGKVSPVEETVEQQSNAIQLELSGVPPELISGALLEHYQGRDVKIWLALLDEGHSIAGEPILLFSGLMDTMDIEAGETATITMTANSRLVRWEEARNDRYNNAAQQARFPGDKGLEFVESMIEKEIVWPGN